MTTRTYTVTDDIAFQALYLPLPANSLIFWTKGHAGGLLLSPGMHYLVNGTAGSQTFVLGPNIVAVGDTITVLTFN